MNTLSFKPTMSVRT